MLQIASQALPDKILPTGKAVLPLEFKHVVGKICKDSIGQFQGGGTALLCQFKRHEPSAGVAAESPVVCDLL